VFGGFLSCILSAGAARADEREKKPASPPQDAHGLPLAPRHVVVIPADRFRCVNVGVGRGGEHAGPARDAAADGHPGDDMITEWASMERHQRRSSMLGEAGRGERARACVWHTLLFLPTSQVVHCWSTF
jgi:hypothetical protein